ncbi:MULTISPECIES: hypothetical protein [unclassified Streptomyces]|nr:MULTISPECIES: hypothetical protein [unclassified Streptomyces]AEN08042.1 hypothetical protein SACTE_0086 [Streptomyces sp. SirexAA-E]PZX42374.1 hypothetical protein K373_00862 [Streptomyces sp. DvalAA-21]RAJ39595.1 hypothetical protein K351_01238 [Streptomyces sp. DpondAA-E10]RAJ53556.1 hypothetical protein K352_00634 [Streptomyces sp. DpondAA-A50]SCE55076.1 hypothetical protein GA0115235_125425 [Streptomyces sp. DpondAA-F4a]
MTARRPHGGRLVTFGEATDVTWAGRLGRDAPLIARTDAPDR